ncbi:hypothetical protein Acor_75460 [Acrocarpospora corrugata]|uniref:DUF2530 domain-containing protein n=1 Tax=Acrocarpospora corrugata TaxID=35763 RepID=A0A5M3WGF6_9ACTN|nr:DUF2530 domain-containing protein [Acrocarpospora corrugata]GES05478.1 hypothetical protein Acor_75460 [Acrocarpospora corrugata]
MKPPRKPDPEPLQTNDSATILVGIGLWVAALLALLVIRPAQSWWIWTCVAGIGLGCFGLTYVYRRNQRQK